LGDTQLIGDIRKNSRDRGRLTIRMQCAWRRTLLSAVAQLLTDVSTGVQRSSVRWLL